MPAAPENSPSGLPDGGATRGARFAAYRRFWTLAAVVLVFDQVTKLLVVAKLPYNALHSHAPGLSVDVMPGFLHLIHVGNTGAAWSILSGRSLLLAGLAAVTLAGIYLWRLVTPNSLPNGQNAFGLLTSNGVATIVNSF